MAGTMVMPTLQAKKLRLTEGKQQVWELGFLI